VLAYRKYYGTAFALRITALMFVTIVLAALAVDGIFGLANLIPTGPRPSRADVFGSIEVDYKLFLNILGLAIFAALYWVSRGRGDTHGCEHHARQAHAHHMNEQEAAGV
jgi:hypothetical protein